VVARLDEYSHTRTLYQRGVGMRANSSVGWWMERELGVCLLCGVVVDLLPSFSSDYADGIRVGMRIGKKHVPATAYEARARRL
jgi:hypothetical protein